MTNVYRQIHAAFRLVCDVAASGHPSDAKRVLLERLVSQLSLFQAFCSTYREFTPTGRSRIDHVEYCGRLPEAAIQAWKSSEVYTYPRRDLLVDRCARHPANFAVLHRQSLVPDAEWYRNGTADQMRGLGLGELMVGWYRKPGGDAITLWLFREADARPFSMQDFRVVRVVLRELRRMSKRGIAWDGWSAQPEPVGMTLRERQVLRLLLDGASSKQVAAELGISTLTVSGYVKAVYRHFDVHSRSELLARFIRRNTPG